MDCNGRFKIDFNGKTNLDGFPFALFVRRPRRWRADEWSFIADFKTREDAVKWYDKVKDLPEYLT